jgi:hypothetical protein
MNIFEEAAHAVAEAGHDIHGWFNPAHYHHNQIATTPGVTVSLAQIEQDLRNAVTDVVTHVKTFETAVAPHLAGLADVAAQVSQSKLVQTVLAATIGPADEEMLVSLIQRLDQGAHDLSQAAMPPPAQPAQPAA